MITCNIDIIYICGGQAPEHKRVVITYNNSIIYNCFSNYALWRLVVITFNNDSIYNDTQGRHTPVLVVITFNNDSIYNVSYIKSLYFNMLEYIIGFKKSVILVVIEYCESIFWIVFRYIFWQRERFFLVEWKM